MGMTVAMLRFHELQNWLYGKSMGMSVAGWCVYEVQSFVYGYIILHIYGFFSNGLADII